MATFSTRARPLPILVAGDPRLTQRSAEIAGVDAAMLAQASDLVATLRDFRQRSGFGRAISAVQCGIPRRLVAMDLGAEPFVLINPEIVWRSDDMFPIWDDCLSVPEILVRGVLERLAQHGFDFVQPVTTANETLVFALPREIRPARR